MTGKLRGRHRRPARPSAVVWRRRLRLAPGPKIELAVHLVCVLTGLVVAGLLAQVVLPGVFPGWTVGQYWLVATWVAVVDSLAGLLHELGHAAVAVAHGRRVYRITLYGLAAAARRAPSRQAHERLLGALAGPLSHLLLAGVLWIGWRLAPSDNVPLRVALALPAATNLLVGVLNLVPLRPLDGGRALEAAADAAASDQERAKAA